MVDDGPPKDKGFDLSGGSLFWPIAILIGLPIGLVVAFALFAWFVQ